MRYRLLAALVAALLLAVPAWAQQYPGALVTRTELPHPANAFNLETDLVQDVTAAQAAPFTLTVASTTNFPATDGYVVVGKAGSLEFMRYDTTTATTFNVVERAMSAGGALAHDASDPSVRVFSGPTGLILQRLIDETIAVEAELGVSPSGVDATVVARLDRIEGEYVKLDGSTPLTGPWAVGSQNITGVATLESDLLQIGGTTVVDSSRNVLNVVGITATGDLDIPSGDVKIGSVSTAGQGGTPLVSIADTDPKLALYKSNAAVDEKNWFIQPVAGRLLFRLSSDDFITNADWMQVDRTGTTIDSVKFPNGQILLAGALRPTVDNGADLGTGSGRVRDVYVATSVRIGTNVASAGAVRLGNGAEAGPAQQVGEAAVQQKADSGKHWLEDAAFYGLAGGYVTAGALDLRQTLVLVDDPALTEGAALSAFVLDEFGDGGLVAMKVAAMAGITAGFTYLWRRADSTWEKALVIGGMGAAVVIQGAVIQSNTEVALAAGRSRR